jgi:choline dehydrogenase-like flavoprotein
MTIYDYLIIGSGTGGGVLAYNLSKAGAHVLLLEAGKYLTKETYPRNEADASAQLYWGGGLEFSHDARMAFLRARVVGGSSVVNQALMDRFDAIALDDWRAETGVEFFSVEAMAPYYDKAESHLALHTFVLEERNRNAELFSEGCDSLGYEWKFLRRAQSDCAYEKDNDCIGCLGGCHRDSKQSTMVVYVREAEKFGLEVQAEVEVDHFEPGETVRVFAKSSSGAKEYQTKNLILAGGAFGTTKMLYLSGYKPKFPALGKYFSSHPQFMFFGVYDEEINAHKGMFQTVTSKDPKFRKNGFKFENVYAGPISTAMLFNVSAHDHQKIMKQYRYMTCAEVALRDENAGEISVDKKGHLLINKHFTDQDIRRRADGTGALKQILAASGAKEVIESRSYFGLHLMGGARMGVDEENAVVAPDFRVFGEKNIYVSDSSLIPNAPGINPGLTVMALSHRLSEELIQ